VKVWIFKKQLFVKSPKELLAQAKKAMGVTEAAAAPAAPAAQASAETAAAAPTQEAA